jgi:ring-1,2-phenylacetyl-CoA epoxidase subunit PaaE
MVSTITTIARNLFLGPPATSVARTASARWERGRVRNTLGTLRVTRVVEETPTTRTYELATMDGSPLAYRAGQHLTVRVDVDGRQERRCYSFSSSPVSGAAPAITVKRVPDGKVSGALHTRIGAGDTLRAAPAAGEFTIDTEPGAARSYVMIAGGVGITPLISLAETVLLEEPASGVHLIYGSRDEGEIIFAERLRALAARFPERLRVDLALDEAPEGWTGFAGPLTGEAVLVACGLAPATGGIAASEADVDGGHPAASASDLYYLCGPTPMMDGAVAALESAGVAAERIRTERFVYAGATPVDLPREPAEVVFATSGARTIARSGQTVLEAARDAGVELPSSCTMGGCGACKVKARGKVVHREPNCLSDREREEGWILACCAHGDGKVEISDY